MMIAPSLDQAGAAELAPVKACAPRPSRPRRSPPSRGHIWGTDRRPWSGSGQFRAELGLLEHATSRAISRISIFHEVDSPARPRDF